MSIGGKGEAIVDNRADGRGVQQYKTLTCAHCNRVVMINPSTGRILHMRTITHVETGLVVDVSWREADLPDVCLKCMAYICDNKVCHAECNPIKQGIDLVMKYPGLAQPFATDERNRYFLNELKKKERIFPGIMFQERKP